MTLVVEHDGTSTTFSGESLLIFIDETGHEEFPDKNAPFFGFGGCLSPSLLYDSQIDEPWKAVQSLFPKEALPLHAADLKMDQMSKKQLIAISNFFKNGVFGRFAAVTSSMFQNETEDTIYHLMARTTYSRILDITRKIHGPDFQQIIMIFEHSERTDKLMGDYFNRYNFQRKDGTMVPIFRATQTKKDELTSGLMVADFVAHTAGAQTRARLRGDKKQRLDFQDIFQTENPNLSSFMEVTRASKGPHKS